MEIIILLIVFVSIIGILIFINWLNNFEPTSPYDKTQQTEDENNNVTKTNDMTKIDSEKNDVISGVNYAINLFKEIGFIENKNDLKIYDQSEKRKDDYFDDAFVINCTFDKTNITHYENYTYGYSTMCVENIKNGEQATIICINSNLSYNISFNINNRLTDTRLKPKLHSCIRKKQIESNMYVGEDIDWYLCFSQREIEKQTIEENIAKLNIPDYITYSWDIDDNRLHFYVNKEEVEQLTISKEDLTKEKILQNVEECKKMYSKKNENINSLKDKINDLFK